MRQAGIVAAGCLHALDHHVERLADDHANATHLAEELHELGFGVTMPDTNLVFVDPAPLGLDAASFAAACAERGVEISTSAPGTGCAPISTSRPPTSTRRSTCSAT